MAKLTLEDEMTTSCLVSRRKNEVRTRSHRTFRMLMTSYMMMLMTYDIQALYDILHLRCLYYAGNGGNTSKILVFNMWFTITTLLRDKCPPSICG